MYRQMNFAALGAIVACAGLAIGCGGGSKTQQPTSTSAEGNTSSAPSGQAAANQNAALVRFVNAIPGRSVDLWVNGSQAFSKIAYKTVTPYKEEQTQNNSSGGNSANSGNNGGMAGNNTNRPTFALTPAGAKAPTGTGAANRRGGIVTNNEGLNNGVRYTVVAMLGNNGKEQLNVITDNLDQPPSGQASVRVINATPEEVNVYSPNQPGTGTANRSRNGAAANHGNGNDELFGGVNSGTATNFNDINPVNGAMRVTPANKKSRNRARALNVPVKMNAGMLYTFVITGGERGAKLDSIEIADNLLGNNGNAGNTGASGRGNAGQR